MDYSKHIQKAEEAARRRNYDFAIQLYQQLLEINPDVGEARAGLRQALLKRHQAKKGGGLFGKPPVLLQHRLQPPLILL